MTSRVLMLIAAAVSLTAWAAAQTPSASEGARAQAPVAGARTRTGAEEPRISELIYQSGEKVIEILSTELPLDSVAQDEVLFTPRFSNSPEERGEGWRALMASGKSRPPGAFDEICLVSATDIMVRRLALSAPSQAQIPLDRACSIPVECEATSMRVTGCYRVKVDLCVNLQNAAHIDKVRSVEKYPESDAANPSAPNPCKAESERREAKKKSAD